MCITVFLLPKLLNCLIHKNIRLGERERNESRDDLGNSPGAQSVARRTSFIRYFPFCRSFSHLPAHSLGANERRLECALIVQRNDLLSASASRFSPFPVSGFRNSRRVGTTNPGPLGKRRQRMEAPSEREMGACAADARSTRADRMAAMIRLGAFVDKF